MLQLWSWKRNRLSRERKTFVDSVPDEVIGIAVKMEDEIHGCCNKEVLEMSQYREEIEQNWKNRGKNVPDLGMELPNGSKILLYLQLVLSSQRTYLSHFDCEADVIL